jgi:hypothetical protein
MVSVSKFAQNFTVVAPAVSNPAFRALQEIGAQASPVQTDLRQQSNDLRSLGNALIEQLRAGNPIERGRALADSETLTRTIFSAIDSASQRFAAVAAYNNQREAKLQRANAGPGAGLGPGGAALALLRGADQNDDTANLFAAINRTGPQRGSRPVIPTEVTASAVKGPKFREDIFERGIPQMVGAGGGASVEIRRRALADETVAVLTDPGDPNSRAVNVTRAVAAGRGTPDNEGFLIEGRKVNGPATAVFDTRDANGEDGRRSSITQNFGDGSDVLFVAGENDTFADGGGGDDLLVGEGNAMIRGGAGDDLVAGDSVFGDAGDDLLFATGFADGGEDDDTVVVFQFDAENPRRLLGAGGAGNDRLIAQDAATLSGDAGDDRILLRAGGVASGGEGNDLITSFDAAEIDAGAGADDVATYGFSDVRLGKGDDRAELAAGGVMRFARGDGRDVIELGRTETPKNGLPRRTNTAVFEGLALGDVTIDVIGASVVVSVNGTTDRLRINQASVSDPLRLRFEKNGMMQIVTIQNTLQTVGPLEPAWPLEV